MAANPLKLWQCHMDKPSIDLPNSGLAVGFSPGVAFAINGGTKTILGRIIA